MRPILRVVVTPRVVKGYGPSFIEDKDTLVPLIPELNLSQSFKLSLQ